MTSADRYESIEEFKSQYIGEWSPSDEHWLGLDFEYNGVEYRFQTYPMYTEEITVLPDGREAIYGLYKKNNDTNQEHEYTLLDEFATTDEALESACIDGIKFSTILMDDKTEITGQD
jgi:hypothetical protein